ncbi:MAG: PEP-CTERM sorting domain-containing protein [Betaproteobacteria bacterium]
MKFARFLVGLGMILAGGLAHAQLTITGSSFLSWSGYNGQPALETGVLSSGVRGTLSALAPGTATFTYLGNESGYTNAFNFSLGSQHLFESSAVGTAISGLVGAGALDFSFSTLAPAGSFSNGSTRIAYIGDVSTAHFGRFDFVLGFNDSYTGDADFDDFVVGVNFASPVPEPETYAILLAGLGMLGFAARRRKLNAAAAA